MASLAEAGTASHRPAPFFKQHYPIPDMRKPIIAANWKMHKIPAETAAFLKDFVVLAKDEQRVDIVIAPPFVSLAAAGEVDRAARQHPPRRAKHAL